MFFRDLNTSDFVQCFEKEKVWLQCQKLFGKVSTDRPWAVVGGLRLWPGIKGLFWPFRSPVLSTYAWWEPWPAAWPLGCHPVRVTSPELSVPYVEPPVLVLLLCDPPTQVGGGLDKSSGVSLGRAP